MARWINELLLDRKIWIFQSIRTNPIWLWRIVNKCSNSHPSNRVGMLRNQPLKICLWSKERIPLLTIQEVLQFPSKKEQWLFHRVRSRSRDKWMLHNQSKVKLAQIHKTQIDWTRIWITKTRWRQAWGFLPNLLQFQMAKGLFLPIFHHKRFIKRIHWSNTEEGWVECRIWMQL
jgi:hypothetical protein